jgi:hypothetical protein
VTSFPLGPASAVLISCSWCDGIAVHIISGPSRGVSGLVCPRQEAERAYLLWKARQVADAAASFAAPPVVEARTRGEAKRRRVEAVLEELRGRVMIVGGKGLPRVSVVPASEGEESEKRAEVVSYVVHDLKGALFLELLELMR